MNAIKPGQAEDSEPKSYKTRFAFPPREFRALCAAFTLVELLVVISIIGVLASLLVGLAGVASTKAKISRVEAELGRYTTAIESYKATFNVYPPDNYSLDPNTRRPRVKPASSPLFYELTGTAWASDVAGNLKGRQSFISPFHEAMFDSGYVEAAFGRKGFLNTAESTNAFKRFVTLNENQHTGVKVGEDFTNRVLVVPVPYPYLVRPRPGYPIPPISNSKANPWRYNSSLPTNNPGSFELWAEFVLGKKLYIRGNWNGANQTLELPNTTLYP